MWYIRPWPLSVSNIYSSINCGKQSRVSRGRSYAFAYLGCGKKRNMFNHTPRHFFMNTQNRVQLIRMHKNLRTSIGVLGGRSGGLTRDGGGQAVVVGIPLFVRNFCIKSCIVNPSGWANCSNFLFRFTVTCFQSIVFGIPFGKYKPSTCTRKVSDLRELFGLAHQLVVRYQSLWLSDSSRRQTRSWTWVQTERPLRRRHKMRLQDQSLLVTPISVARQGRYIRKNALRRWFYSWTLLIDQRFLIIKRMLTCVVGLRRTWCISALVWGKALR